jgi:hypothetical protein
MSGAYDAGGLFGSVALGVISDRCVRRSTSVPVPCSSYTRRRVLCAAPTSVLRPAPSFPPICLTFVDLAFRCPPSRLGILPEERFTSPRSVWYRVSPPPPTTAGILIRTCSPHPTRWRLQPARASSSSSTSVAALVSLRTCSSYSSLVRRLRRRVPRNALGQGVSALLSLVSSCFRPLTSCTRRRHQWRHRCDSVDNRGH